MVKPTPNPPETENTSPYESADSTSLHEAAQRALDHHLYPTQPKRKRRKSSLFSVNPDVSTEILLANASEDLLGIANIAANLADTVDGTNRSVALTLNRMAESVYLLVDRAMDDLDEPEMAAIVARRKNKSDAT